MGRSAGLGAWLATLGAAQLEALLRARPDVLRHPRPEDLNTLANRLTTPSSVTRAQRQLHRPAFQVAEALLALGGAATRHELLRLLGAADDTSAARVDAVLHDLQGLALAWPVHGRVRLVSGWSSIPHDPLGLGRSARELYRQLTPAQLARIGSGLGTGGHERGGDRVEAVAAAVADPTAVQARLAHAAPAVEEVVRRLAWHGPRMSGVEFPEPDEVVGPERIGRLLAVQGWVVPMEWGIGEMPREVALAVRGPGYHAPFEAQPPPLANAPVEPGQVRKAGEHAALAACESVRRLVSLLDRAPLTTVQSGGVGVRELRRAAKQLSADVDAVRLWLETSAAVGLVALAHDTERPTTLRRGYSPPVGVALATAVADEWSAADPGHALARLLLAWWHLPLVPSLRLDESGRPAPALVRAFGHPEHPQLRAAVFRALAGLAPDRGIVEPEALLDHLAHHAPIEFDVPHDTVPRLRATLAEAELLGLVSAGALTPIGQHLLAAVRTADPPAALGSALAGVLPPPSRRATFLPDLTALVAGTAAPALARLLDTAAEAESRDTASIWRFSADSVRRALDAGHPADALLAELTEAADNPLPQPLEYLVRDVARRHGEIQVVAVSTCIRVADAALGAELVAQRALGPLRLRPLTDTVLAAELPVEETLAALRSAGYAPVHHDSGGVMVVQRSPVRRAEVPARAEPYQQGAPLDVGAIAAALSEGR